MHHRLLLAPSLLVECWLQSHLAVQTGSEKQTVVTAFYFMSLRKFSAQTETTTELRQEHADLLSRSPTEFSSTFSSSHPGERKNSHPYIQLRQACQQFQFYM